MPLSSPPTAATVATAASTPPPPPPPQTPQPQPTLSDLATVAAAAAAAAAATCITHAHLPRSMHYDDPSSCCQAAPTTIAAPAGPPAAPQHPPTQLPGCLLPALPVLPPLPPSLPFARQHYRPHHHAPTPVSATAPSAATAAALAPATSAAVFATIARHSYSRPPSLVPQAPMSQRHGLLGPPPRLPPDRQPPPPPIPTLRPWADTATHSAAAAAADAGASPANGATARRLAQLATVTILRLVARRWRDLLHQQEQPAQAENNLRGDSAVAATVSTTGLAFPDPLRTPLTPPNTPRGLHLPTHSAAVASAAALRPVSTQKPGSDRFHPYTRPAPPPPPPLPSPYLSTPGPQVAAAAAPAASTVNAGGFPDPLASVQSGSSPAPAAAATSPPPTQTTPAARAFLAAYARQHAGPVRALATAAQVALGLPPHAVVLALLYARRLLSASVGRLPAALSTPSKVLLAGLVLADAHLCDATVPMRAWAAATAARGGGAQVAAIKAAALDALQFGIAVDAATYSRWMMSVDAFFQSVASDDGSDAAVVAAAASETS